MELHNGLTRELLCGARYAILPGDPGRVERIASLLDSPRELAFHREYRSFLGTLSGEPVLVISTGIGGPSTAICVEELNLLGIDTLLRCGTCAAMQQEVEPGDCILVTGAIRQEGTAREYLPLEFPAIADFTVVSCMKRAAERLGLSHHVGIVHCKDSLWGQRDPDTMPMAGELKAKWNAWRACGTLGCEMESATLFTVSSVRHLRAGAVMLCVWNQIRRDMGLAVEEVTDPENAARIAVETIRELIRYDRKQPLPGQGKPRGDAL